jgi:hypothetical protein
MRSLYIPNGPKNIASLFPTIDLHQVAEYFLELVDSGDAIIATTTRNIIDSCREDNIRIHFVNYAGTIDAMNFRRITVDHEPKAETYEKRTGYPLAKDEHGISRFNVKSNDTYVVRTVEYGEEQMQWIDELLDSPVAWMEWAGTQGQPDSYIPIMITDQKSQKVKEEDRYIYEVTLTFKLSHERFIIRN